MWYKENISVKTNEPIFATIADGVDDGGWILLPFVPIGNDGSRYEVIGYRWFNLLTGRYDTVGLHKTIADALTAYGKYKIFNGKLKAGI